MDRQTEITFFCKRCRATQVKRCGCPLPVLRPNHNWESDAAYNLWPDVPVGSRPWAGAAWGGHCINLAELLDQSTS
jgi:hypothetical protein